MERTPRFRHAVASSGSRRWDSSTVTLVRADLDPPALIQRLRELSADAEPSSGLDSLRDVTRQLVRRLGAGAVSEYQRFLSIEQRGIAVAAEPAHAGLSGKVILVTGGTGCIGSNLLAQLTPLAPVRLVSLARGVTAVARPDPNVEYLQADVGDAAAVDGVVKAVHPDLVFHLAPNEIPARLNAASSRP